jgi:hypothetical protein
MEASVLPRPVLPAGAVELCASPLIFVVDEFLSAAEIARFQFLSAGRMRRAQVIGGSTGDVDAPKLQSERRTNTNCWIGSYDSLLADVRYAPRKQRSSTTCYSCTIGLTSQRSAISHIYVYEVHIPTARAQLGDN